MLLLGYMAVVYKYHSQTSSAFYYFLSNFEKMLQEISAFKPDFSKSFVDLNVWSKSWWNSDSNTNEGTKIDAVTSAVIWFTAIDISTNTSVSKFLFLHWLYICWSNHFGSWL